MASTDNKKEGPNYPKIAGLSVVGGAVGAGIGAALKLGTVGLVGAGGGGFAVVMVALLSTHAAGDAKKGLAENQVKRLTEEAWNAEALGRKDKAEKFLLEALTAAQPLGEKNLLVLTTTHSLANLYRLQKKYDKAETYFTKAMSIYAGLGLNDINAAMCARDQALTLLALKKLPEAQESISKALGFLEKQENRDLAQALAVQARIQQQQGQLPQAVQAYLRVRTLQEKLEGNTSADVLRTSITIARVYREQKQLAEALDIYKDLIGRINKAERPVKIVEAEAFIEMAEVCTEMGQLNNVEPLLIAGLKILQQYIGPNADLLGRIQKTYQEARTKLNLGLKEEDILYLFTLEREKIRNVLAEKPALVQAKDKSGWGPLHWSCFLGRDDLIKWLLRNGAKTEEGDASKVMAPLHVASAWAKGGTTKALIEAGAPLDTPGPQGWTPLLFAAAGGKMENLDMLLTRGASIEAKDSQGKTALHLAAESGNVEAVTLLLGKGCDANARDDKYGQTPLHMAVMLGYGSVAEVLINNRADLFVQDKSGKTPAQVAEMAGHTILHKAILFQEKLARGDIKG